MKFQRLIVTAMGAAALGFATLTLTMSSNAQGGAPQGPGAGPRGQGFPAQPGVGPGAGGPQGFPGAAPGFAPGANAGQFRPGPGGFAGGGGGTAMDSDNNYLYIVQGGQLFKVAKSDLKIMNSIPLGMGPGRDGFPMPEQGPNQFGGPQRRGGGGGATPPPPPANGQ